MIPIKTQYPQYTMTLPLTQIKVNYRPYLVKEEKILLMALQSNNPDDYLNAIKQIVNNCCNTELNIENLPVVDVEYFFLNLRAKSVGEIVEPVYKCENLLYDGSKCNTMMKLSIDITKIQPSNIKSQNEMKIILSGNMGVQMKYPKFNMVKKDEKNELEYLQNLIVSCIDYIFNGEDIYYAKDYNTEDLIQFLDSLSKQQFSKLEQFFEELPVLKHVETHKCQKCNFEHTITLEGYESFFI